MKKRQLFYLAFILLLLGGCNDETSEIFDDTPINKDGSIAFRTDSIITKGTPQGNLEAYNQVNLIVYSHEGNYADTSEKSLYRQIELNKDDSGSTLMWNYSPHMFWPEGRGLSFLAYTIETSIPYATATDQEGVFVRENKASTAPIIEYAVPSDVKKQPDLLVTMQLNHPKSKNVTLSMKHALSCVSFCATAPKGVTDMKVKNIKIRNIYTKGYFSLDDASIKWTLDEKSKTDLIVREPGIDPDESLKEDPSSNYNYLMSVDGYLMMLPQTLKSATIDVTYILNEREESTTYNLPTDIVWESGKKYIYKFGEDLEEVVVYYEKYADGTYGFQNEKGLGLDALDDLKEIVEAGYGVVTKSTLVSKNPTITLKNGSAIATKKVAISGGYNLYAVSQTSIEGSTTFVLPATPEPVEVYFDGNNVWCGHVIPHFAKGATQWNPTEYSIRTPQQMRNISAITNTSSDSNNSNPSYYKTMKQERNLDFSVVHIGGGVQDRSVVDDVFEGTYYSDPTKSISNLIINAPESNKIGLFSTANGAITDLTLKSSTITGLNSVGGIAGYAHWGGLLTRVRVIGTNSTTGCVKINGRSEVGGLVGENRGTIVGSDQVDPATEITYAELSGWVNITGSGNRVGGIAGYNATYAINKVLVNGVYVTGTTLGDLEQAKIVIKGVNYVGGIAGQNDVEINGNVTGTGTDMKNMPDVAGIVEIRGVSSVGGIAGSNSSTGKLNSVNIRLGREPAMIIEGTDSKVGGIVGENSGTLGVQSSNTFISTRGNIEITGRANVGGIVGYNNAAGRIENCFVYDFYSQGSGKKVYYAPKIKSLSDSAGGIAGYNEASISNSCVFSANKDVLLSISSDMKNAGGLIGSNSSGGKTELCSVVGKIEVVVKDKSAGGIAGDNKSGTTITNCWIGSSDENGNIANAVANLGLVVTAPGVTASYGQPVVTGDIYIGGIVGLNDGGIIDGVTLKDNITIGRKFSSSNILDGSNWVGGIAGGNTASYLGTNSIIRNCKVENTATTTVTIQGSRNLGGIVGLNNGIVSVCTVSGVSANHLKIIGLGTIGGIVGQHGGHKDLVVDPPHSGNEYTTIKNCSVTGFVTLEGDITEAGYKSATEVGGIAGIAGPNKDNVVGVENCSVGKAGVVNISVSGTSGGIVGTNAAKIRGCDVYNATIKSTIHPGQSESTEPYAGGIAGMTITNSTVFNPDIGKYCSDINDCRVYSATITSHGWSVFVDTHAGALVGYLNSDIAFAFGKTTTNQVNNSGVIVNNGNKPATGTFIVGTANSNGAVDPVYATIAHTVTVVAARPQ